MNEEQMMKRIKELEEENERLKNRKPSSTIKGSMKNQAELAFVVPFYRVCERKWKMSTVGYEFTHIRKLAMSAVNKVDISNKFTEQKVNELSEEDLAIAVDCADEIVKVVAKYKKLYLESVGRGDIVKAFNM